MDNSKSIKRKNPNKYDPEKQGDDFKNRLNDLIDKSENPKDTKRALAAQLGVTEEMIRLYTIGNSFPNTQKLMNIARFFNCSLNYLVGLSKVKSPDASITGACQHTGLSEESIEKLTYLQQRYNIDFFIQSDGFEDFIKSLDSTYQDAQNVNISIRRHRGEMETLGEGIDRIYADYLKDGYMYFPDALQGSKWKYIEASSLFLSSLIDIDKIIENATSIRDELFDKEYINKYGDSLMYREDVADEEYQKRWERYHKEGK